ncbi:MAG: tetratricopeptide repeat protein [Terracidiphilus sp.]
MADAFIALRGYTENEGIVALKPEALVKTNLLGWIAASVLAGVAFRALGQTAGSPPSIDPAVLAKANAGDDAAEAQVGDSCSAGRDYKQAVAWYTKAANQGNITAELDLARLYRDGRGKLFARDADQAAAWYRKAADQGDPRAQGALGMLYTLGQGVPRSDVEAYYWLDLAAAVKSPDQDQYVANRQNVGTRITADELEDVEERVAAWKAKHPRPE